MRNLTAFDKPTEFEYEGPVFSINNKICANCGEPHIYMSDKELYDDSDETGTANCGYCGATYEIPYFAASMDFSKLSLVTSNVNKLNEYRQMKIEGLTVRPGLDLKEVDADAKTVITYKAFSAGAGMIVEDTSLFIDGADVGTNIRWNMDRLDEFIGRKALFEVWIGVNLGKAILLFRGQLQGEICTAPATSEPVFDFDNNFMPNGERRTLHQLAIVGEKHKYSPRKHAIYKMRDGAFDDIVEVSAIKEWIGSYQG